jgi:hypothetical protein
VCRSVCKKEGQGLHNDLGSAAKKTQEEEPMARRKSTGSGVDWKAALLGDDGFREWMRIAVQQVLVAEMDDLREHKKEALRRLEAA